MCVCVCVCVYVCVCVCVCARVRACVLCAHIDWCFLIPFSPCTGLTVHASILAFMFSVVEEGKITVPLGGGAEGVGPQGNAVFVRTHLGMLLKQAFPHLQE